MPTWARLVVAVAAAKVGIGITLFLSGQLPVSVSKPLALWVYAALAAVFGVLGLALSLGNRKDVRAAWLGAVYVLIAAPLVTPLIGAHTSGFLGLFTHLRAEAFLPAFLWRFVSEFPSSSERAPRRVAESVAAVASVFAWLCTIVNLSYLTWPAETGLLPWRTSLTPGASASRYWPTLFGLSATAFPMLMWRARSTVGEQRRRVMLFVTGLIAGSVPFLVQVTLEELFPAYSAFVHRPGIETPLTVFLFGSLAAIACVTTYSVLFDRVVEVRVVVRAALQYAFARYVIFLVAAMPFAALAVFVFGHRQESVITLLAGPRPVLLVAATALGILTLRRRPHWLDALDRRFFREQYDARQILTKLMSQGLHVTGTDELSARISEEIERALHVKAELFVADDQLAVLRSAGGRLASISTTSTLAGLAFADAGPMDVDLRDLQSPLRRLPDTERRWLEEGGFRLLVGLRSGSGIPAGLLALSEKRSGLPFSDDDRHLLGAVAASATLALGNLRLQTPHSLDESAAQECVECSRLSPSETTLCSCGGAVLPAAAPYTLRGVFRFERRIGAGGMGVVYSATDLNLHRLVAIKTLPRVTPEHGARLRREARAMATLAHPNLAVIYGVETWRGVPFVVEELLAGGTLADRLAIRRLSPRDAIDLGITLARALEYVHGTGFVHCDIKPSNIGFTQTGVVKLLDFGLARLLRETMLSPDATTGGGAPPGPSSSIVLDIGGAGTPAYMPPEAVRGDSPCASFDLWALAVVLYEAIAGCRPFEGRSPAEVFARIARGTRPDLCDIRQDCPKPVAAFIADALSNDVARRPPDALSFIEQLTLLRQGN
jgi:hypothetical protein